MKRFVIYFLLFFTINVVFDIAVYTSNKNDILRINCSTESGTDECSNYMEKNFDPEKDNIKDFSKELNKKWGIMVVKDSVFIIILTIFMLVGIFDKKFRSGLKGRYRFIFLSVHLLLCMSLIHSFYELLLFLRGDSVYSNLSNGIFSQQQGFLQFLKMIATENKIRLLIKKDIAFLVVVFVYILLFFKIRKKGNNSC